jgi:hypothetical protein
LVNYYEQQAVSCLRRTETYRNEWFAGLTREIDIVKERAEAGDKRFRGMTSKQREVTGRLRWSLSAKAHHLAHLEQKYRSWAEMYLAFAEYQLPIKARHDAANGDNATGHLELVS